MVLVATAALHQAPAIEHSTHSQQSAIQHGYRLAVLVLGLCESRVLTTCRLQLQTPENVQDQPAASSSSRSKTFRAYCSWANIARAAPQTAVSH